MSNLPELEINTRLEIEVDDDEFGGRYFSRVMDINSKELRIMAVAVQGVSIQLRVNTPIYISYVGERAMYGFRSIVKQRFHDVLAGYIVELPKDVDRIQRREYVRLEVQTSFRYRIFAEPGDSQPAPRPFEKSYIVDISGGGVRFFSEEVITVGTVLEMRLGIEGIERDIVVGRVVRCRERVEGGYEIGVSFEAVSPATQDQIISWIFNKQRELRKKGLA